MDRVCMARDATGTHWKDRGGITQFYVCHWYTEKQIKIQVCGEQIKM